VVHAARSFPGGYLPGADPVQQYARLTDVPPELPAISDQTMFERTMIGPRTIASWPRNTEPRCSSVRPASTATPQSDRAHPAAFGPVSYGVTLPVVRGQRFRQGRGGLVAPLSWRLHCHCYRDYADPRWRGESRRASALQHFVCATRACGKPIAEYLLEFT
jgi:hypothetical protein